MEEEKKNRFKINKESFSQNNMPKEFGFYQKLKKNNINKCICQIIISQKKGTGFFCDLLISKDDILKCLITNNHILNENYLDSKKKLDIFIEDNKNSLTIDLSEKRYMHTNEEMDYTVIEILEKDNVFNFLKNDCKSTDYIDEKIYAFQYPKINNFKLSISEGQVKKVYKEFTFLHDAGTDKGSSGSPIILQKNNKVIGVHYGGEDDGEDKKKNKINFGVYIESIIDDIKKNNSIIERENSFDKFFYKILRFFQEKITKIFFLMIFCLFIYISIFHIKIHKIIKYKNGNIKYDGYILRNKYEGYGILYYKNGNKKYKGDWHNNKANGNGTQYYENGNILFNGIWENNYPKYGKEYNENEKIIYEGFFKEENYDIKGTIYGINGEKIYDGEFKDGNKCGFGIEKKGELKYYGFWKNDNKEGFGELYNETSGNIIFNGTWVLNKPKKGKYYKPNGKLWYIGYMNSEGVPHGNGISYYENGNIFYNGTFFLGLKEGFGKEYDENKQLNYEGHYTSDKKDDGKLYFDNGKSLFEGKIENEKPLKGKLYYNGSILYDGEFKNGGFEGKGIEYYNNGNIRYNGTFKDSKYNGYGIKYYNNKILYEGYWEDDKLHGSGTFYDYYYKNIKIEGFYFKNYIIEGKSYSIYDNTEKGYNIPFLNNIIGEYFQQGR